MLPMRYLLAAALAWAPQSPPVPPPSTGIDEGLRRQGVRPAPPCDDATFLRRASLDLTGRLPLPDQAYAFIHDKAPNKRARLLDELLASRQYAEFWTDYWTRTLLGNEGKGAQQVDRAVFRAWLFQRFNQNTPWNDIVTGLVAATGRNSPLTTTGPQARGFERMDPDRAAALLKADPEVNGATNWLLHYIRRPQDLAGATSKTFLGVQIQCAQCHDHKTEKWTQADFRGFASAFAHLRMEPGAREKGRPVRAFELRDVPRVAFPGNPNEDLKPFLNAPPRTLEGQKLEPGPGTRRALAAWMTDGKNPWFAAALVNRMWAHCMGAGLVEPADDLPADPGKLPPLLRSLAGDFAAQGFDLRRLLRTLCLSQAYQAASRQGDASKAEGGAGHPLRPLRPEVLMDALMDATGLEAVLQRQMPEKVEGLKARLVRQFVFLFQVDEDHEQRSFEGTIPQALMLLNGRLTQEGSALIPGNALAQILHQPGDDASKIQALYLRTLSREARPEEVDHWMAFLRRPRPVWAPSPSPTSSTSGPAPQPGKDPDGLGPLRRVGARGGARDARGQAFEDLFWALLNASEFNLNH